VFFLGTKQRERRKKRDLLFAFFHRKREKKIFCYFLCLLVDFFIRKHNKEKKIKTLTHLSIHKSGFTIYVQMTSGATQKESWDPEEYAITPSSFEIVAKEKVVGKKGGKNKGNYDENDDYDQQNPQRRREDGHVMMPTLSEKMWEKLYGNKPKSIESLNEPCHVFLGEKEENAKEDRGSVDGDGSAHQNQLMQQRKETDSFADAKASRITVQYTNTTEAVRTMHSPALVSSGGGSGGRSDASERNRSEANTAAWFRGRCLAVNCGEMCTAQGYLCKFHRVAKSVILERDKNKEEVRWCHYCKKVQKLSEFTEESKTLCHAKYVLRCKRSKKNREMSQIKRQEKAAMEGRSGAAIIMTSTPTTTAMDEHSREQTSNTSTTDGTSLMDVGRARSGGSGNIANIANNNAVTSNAQHYSEKRKKALKNRKSREAIPEELMMLPENPFFANLLEENFLSPMGNMEKNNDEFDWTSTIEITNHRVRVDAHPADFVVDNEMAAAAAGTAMVNPNNAIWKELSQAGLVTNDDHQIEYAQIAPGSTILSWQSFRQIHTATREDFVIPDDTLKENDFTRGKPVRDSSIFLRNFMSYSGFRSRGGSTRGRASTEQAVHARRSRGNDGSIEVFKTHRSHLAWVEEAGAPLVAVVGRPFMVRLGADFRANEITAVRAYGAFGTRKISADEFSPSGIATFPAETFASMANFNGTGGGLFWIQFETVDDRCSIPKPALILPDLQMAVDTHLALRSLRSEHAMRCAIQDIGSVLSFAESGYMYEDEMREWSRSIIRQCEQSPPFQENARSLIALLQTVADEIKEHEKEMKPKADRTMTMMGSCEATDVHSDSDVLYWVPNNPNMHEYEMNDYFEEWYDDDMNEFRYGNRCAMMVYGQAIYIACFLIHLFRLCRLFNIHPLWAFWCNGSALWLSFKTIFTPGGLKEYSKPRYFYLGVWWSFFWYGRVATPIIMKDDEHSDRARTMLTVCIFIACTLGFWHLKTRDAIVGPTFTVLFCYYEFIYASIYSIVQNEDRMVHIRTFLTEYVLVLIGAVFTTLYLQVAAKSLALRRCKAKMHEARMSFRGKVKTI
jgi:hypothetical protein